MLIVIVCTGNTCRSPMAEAMLRKLVAERLGCTPDEVEQRGVIDRVGRRLGGARRRRRARSGRSRCAQRGLDLSRHESQPLTDKAGPARRLDPGADRRPPAGDRPPLAGGGRRGRTSLRLDGGDIDDPIGGPAEVYQPVRAANRGSAARATSRRWSLSKRLLG